jgi:hypothetical protein
MSDVIVTRDSFVYFVPFVIFVVNSYVPMSC